MEEFWWILLHQNIVTPTLCYEILPYSLKFHWYFTMKNARFCYISYVSGHCHIFFYFITSWRNFDHPNAELKVLWVEKIGVSLFWCNIFWRNIILAVQKIWWILLHQIMLPRVLTRFEDSSLAYF